MKSCCALILKIILLAVLFSICETALPQAASTAAEPKTLHLADFHIRDPWILADKATRTYYLYATNDAKVTGVDRAGVMAYRSRDLRTWDSPVVVFSVPDDTWVNPKEIAWAPEVHAYRGKFYLFVTLHNSQKILAAQPAVRRTNTMRGTTIAVSDSPDGPFTLVKTDGPIPPADFMTLDGTLYLDPAGKPWMVYAHEWQQKIDGTMETVPLAADLTRAVGPPIFLFKGSDAPWLDSYLKADTRELSYVTDGPELYRTRDGHLLMLWSSFGPGGYIETVARSKTGDLTGPWAQLPPLLEVDGGHGMLFHCFDGQLMLVLHRTNTDPYAKIYEMKDEGDRLEVLRERVDLDCPK